MIYYLTDGVIYYVKRKTEQTIYDGIKRMVVETMEKEHLSIYAAMQEFGINDHKIIERWERIYLEEGPEACRLSDGAAAALVGQRSCQKR